MDASQRRPTAGVRYALERAAEEESGATYRGFAHLPDADLPLEVRVEQTSEGGAEGRANVTARIEGAAVGVDVAGLEKAGAALVKAALRAARDAGRAMPRRIVRWRGPT
ncbi:hypothetical protein [Polyangium jinanense]|uniref:Uncharacterized protein n=1 Tax=Polyangium jinanense TaxID=2829994 RepID=A0A9X3X782_9BACT|nr:hypothetical protein [Polyangium jinanense]MDC3957925.1 hypothetical protein [Polyangium jinanense]MDC3961976.1 hypothetical protein [Polyangium jinanense]MDC3983478.1 hypothetical protein [Polyangium jinanense]